VSGTIWMYVQVGHEFYFNPILRFLGPRKIPRFTQVEGRWTGCTMPASPAPGA